MKANVNYRLWVIIMCQCRLINFLTNVLLWWVMLTVGEAVCVGDIGTLYFLINYAVNLKLLLKIVYFGEFPGGPVSGLHALTAKGLDLMHDQGTKIPQATQCGQINKPYSLILANGPN